MSAIRATGVFFCILSPKRREIVMPKTSITLGSLIVGSIAFEMQYLHATGGPEFPQLVFVLDLNLSAYQEYQQSGQPAVRPLTWVLVAGEFCSPQDRMVAQFRDEVGLYASEPSRPQPSQLRLNIPLDTVKIGRMEQSRSGDLRAALTFRPLLAIHSLDGAVHCFEVARADNIAFEVPKSQWVEKLLPQLGYGGLELLEVRIGHNVRAEGLPQAVQELRNAQKHLSDGNWDEAVAHCRKAIEAIPESRPLQLTAADRSFGIKVDTLVGEHLKGLGKRQAKFIADEMKLLWGISSKAAHASPNEHFARADAELLVRITMAVTECMGRLLS